MVLSRTILNFLTFVKKFYVQRFVYMLAYSTHCTLNNVQCEPAYKAVSYPSPFTLPFFGVNYLFSLHIISPKPMPLAQMGIFVCSCVYFCIRSFHLHFCVFVFFTHSYSKTHLCVCTVFPPLLFFVPSVSFNRLSIV